MVSRVFQDFPFLYSQAGDLTVSDVEDLLSNYKQLVSKYVSLAKGLGVTNSSPPLSNAQSQNVMLPDAAEEPESISEAHAADNTQNDLPGVASDSPKSSVSQLENTEPKMAEETALISQGEEGIENQDPQ